MPTRSECDEMPIEILGVSEKCSSLMKLKSINTVGDALDFIKLLYAVFESAIWDTPLLGYVPEIEERLKIIECWSDETRQVDE